MPPNCPGWSAENVLGLCNGPKKLPARMRAHFKFALVQLHFAPAQETFSGTLAPEAKTIVLGVSRWSLFWKLYWGH